MGLKRGEIVAELGTIQIVSVRRERLCDITAEDVAREGFPDMTPGEFVEFFCKSMKVYPEIIVTRIEFKYLSLPW